MGLKRRFFTGFLRCFKTLRLKEESDVDDLIEMGREFHSFAPLNEKKFCAVSSLNLGRARRSAVAWRV